MELKETVPQMGFHSLTPYGVDNPDLWLASKINFTRKDQRPIEIYNEKNKLPEKERDDFIRIVRDSSINRQHLGASVVSPLEYEILTSSLVSMNFALGKFYNMQQQTRRSVILSKVIENQAFIDAKVNEMVMKQYRERFDFYWDLCDKRDKKVKGFDLFIQDSFKILPLNTTTRFVANLSFRTSKQYARWRTLDYLPEDMKMFARQMHKGGNILFPIFYNTKVTPTAHIQKRFDGDILLEPRLWYADHSFLIPESTVFDHYYNHFNLKHELKHKPAILLHSTIKQLGITLNDIMDYINPNTIVTRLEDLKAKFELAQVTFASRLDLSGAIDSWRHTRNNRIVQPLYHAIGEGLVFMLPELYQRQVDRGDNKIPDRFMEFSQNSQKLMQELVRDHHVPIKEAINVLPHNIRIIQIESMDFFSFLNLMGLRTCIHARTDVQTWAMGMMKEMNNEINGITDILEFGGLPRAFQQKYCAEYVNCNRCPVPHLPKNTIHLPTI